MRLLTDIVSYSSRKEDFAEKFIYVGDAEYCITNIV